MVMLLLLLQGERIGARLIHLGYPLQVRSVCLLAIKCQIDGRIQRAIEVASSLGLSVPYLIIEALEAFSAQEGVG